MAEKQSNKDRLKEITNSIENGIKELFESEKYKNYLRTMSRFHKYSVNNTIEKFLLILSYIGLQTSSICCKIFRWKVRTGVMMTGSWCHRTVRLPPWRRHRFANALAPVPPLSAQFSADYVQINCPVHTSLGFASSLSYMVISIAISCVTSSSSVITSCSPGCSSRISSTRQSRARHIFSSVSVVT